jgi:hypothetical protein
MPSHYSSHTSTIPSTFITFSSLSPFPMSEDFLTWHYFKPDHDSSPSCPSVFTGFLQLSMRINVNTIQTTILHDASLFLVHIYSYQSRSCQYDPLHVSTASYTSGKQMGTQKTASNNKVENIKKQTKYRFCSHSIGFLELADYLALDILEADITF